MVRISSTGVSCNCQRRLLRGCKRRFALIGCRAIMRISAAAILLVLLCEYLLRKPPPIRNPAPGSAIMLHRLGLRWLKDNRTDDSLMVLHKAKEMHKNAGSFITSAGISVINDICIATKARKDNRTDNCYSFLAETLAQATEAEREEITFEALQRGDPIEACTSMAAQFRNEALKELEYTRTTMHLCRVLGGMETFRCAENLIKLGVVESKNWPGEATSADVEKILKLYGEAKDILYRIGATTKPSYAYLVHNIGVCKGQKNDYKGEARSHEEAVGLLDKIGHNGNTMYTHIIYDLVTSLFRVGDDESARMQLEKANAVFDNFPKLRSSNRAGSLQAIGDMRADDGFLEEAMVSYQLAHDVHDQMGTLKTEAGKGVKEKLAVVRKKVGNRTIPVRKIVTFESEYLQLRRVRPSPSST